MRRAVFVAFLLMLGRAVLGATVLRHRCTGGSADPDRDRQERRVGPGANKVTNSASAPVPVTVGNLPAVQNVAVQAPELWGKRVVIAGNNPAVFICPPEGKKFIVQSFSAGATVPEGSSIIVYMRTGDFDSGVYLPIQNVGGTGWVGAVTGPVLAIVPAGCLFVAVEGFTNTFNGMLDGYLLPA